MNARHEATGPDYDRPDRGPSSREPADRGPRDGTESAYVDGREDRRTVVGREKEKYGGVKIGSAFFGWLTATGAAVLLKSSSSTCASNAEPTMSKKVSSNGKPIAVMLDASTIVRMPARCAANSALNDTVMLLWKVAASGINPFTGIAAR